MRRLKRIAELNYHPTLCSGVSGFVFLLGLSVAQATPFTIDGGAVYNQTGSDPVLDVNDMIIIGDTSTGTLNIYDGGEVSGVFGYIGVNSGSSGTVLVSGSGSQWNTSNNLYIGYDGSGELTIANGALVSNSIGMIGRNPNSNGKVAVTGMGSQWNNSDKLFVGHSFNDASSLDILNGGTVLSSHGEIGYNIGSKGTVIVSGVGSQWNMTEQLYVGNNGEGELIIANGGAVTNVGNGYIGGIFNAKGTVVVSGIGSTWKVGGNLYFGSNSSSLMIADGGKVSSASGQFGFQSPNGNVNVSGTGSLWDISGDLTSYSISATNTGQIQLGIFGGGIISNINTELSLATITVSDANSHWNMSGILTLVEDNTLAIINGGLVSNTNGYINTGSKVILAGADSQWIIDDTLSIGEIGRGSLTIGDNSEVSALTVNITNNIGSIGSLNIGAAAGEMASGAGVLNSSAITFGDGNGEIVFNHLNTDYAFAPSIHGTGNLFVYSGTTVLTGNNNYFGLTTVSGGTLASGGTGTLSSNADYVTESGGTLALNGYSETIASLDHSGTLNFGDIPGAALTITDHYVGHEGQLNFNIVLDDDNSITDKLVIAGDTSGTTYVTVNNQGGGGTQTLNGIELITVLGASDGEFVQNGRIVAGAYDYYLNRGIDSNAANWYLNSSIPQTGPGETPPVEMIERPEASGYSANLAAANNLFITRLHDRLGDTHYIDAFTGEHKVTSLWLRNEGGHNRSRDTQDQLRTQSHRYVMQLGGNLAQWSSDGSDRFYLGIMAGYGNSKSRTESRLSSYRARATVDGYSAGLYGSWYANNIDKTGLYVDSWAQYSWFNNSVNGQNLNTEKYKSKGMTASVESGYTFNVGENMAKNATYLIQPKAQITWMAIKADDHKETNGTNVSGEGDGNIQTRLGLKAFMNGYSDQDKSKNRVYQPFVEANWLHNTKDFGTTMDGMTVKQSGAKNLGELKLGVEGQLNKNMALWGNIGQQVGNKGYSDTALMIGAKYTF
ncbi:autotransporter outer membrane beta-barrel domain-containing protein [Yersinia frederiksenii]|uniref:autotransporter outer membrane beta-barrel domain-containing protein n=1 Tax=Yersinia frederiksenii TaxID=29484 RepID=UPI0005E74C3B|nr:autotransporter outer membrane beta-barrel domain-containing protein [Yersinia frederiksenii]CNF86645.1 autotransporter protein [Yersinia frederiksenii]